MEGIDFDRIKRSVDIVAVIGGYVTLTRSGPEYVCCCPFHKEKSPSFCVVPSKGFFYCFGCGATGDVLDFLQQINNISLQQAAEMLGAGLIAPPENYRKREDDAPPPPKRITKIPPGNLSRNPPGIKSCRQPGGDWLDVTLARAWKYTNEIGELAFFVCRYEWGVGEKRKKETPQYTYGSLDEGQSWRWGWGHFNEPRFLYNLYEIVKKPQAPILIVEGEKAADAAQKLLPMYVVTTWSGGTNAVEKTDWSPIAGRKILIWPDNDDPGRDAAEQIALLINGPAEIKILQPGQSLEKGWDAADALESGWDSRMTVSWAKQWHKVWTDPRSQPDEEEQPEERPMLRVIDGGKDTKPEPEEGEFYIWGRPADPFRSMKAPEWNPEHFPKSIAAFADDEADRSGADAGAIAMAAIVCCASVIHPNIQIAVKRHDTGWKEGARLWCIVVGDPSVKKTMSVAKSVEPVKRIGNKLMEEYASKIREYEREFEMWTMEKKNAQKVGSVPPATPEKPVLARTLVDDTTTEALSKILQDCPRGVLSYNDEMGGWFGQMDAYRGKSGNGSSKDASFWLRCYNGESAMVDRVGRDTLFIPRLSVSLVGSMQPDALRRLNLPEDGLMQRFMVVLARRGKEKDRQPNADIIKGYYNLIYRIYSVTPAQDFTLVRLTEEAQVYREAMFEKIEEMIEGSKQISNSMCSAFGKYQGLWARLALVYHCIDCCERSVHPQGTRLTENTAIKVSRLMTEYLRMHLMVFYMGDKIHKGTALLEHARWIAGYILAHGPEARLLTNRTVTRSYKIWSALPEWDQKRVYEILESLEWIKPIKDRYAAGGKVTQWAVNPAVHAIYAEQASREKHARRAIKDQMSALMRGMEENPRDAAESDEA